MNFLSYNKIFQSCYNMPKERGFCFKEYACNKYKKSYKLAAQLYSLHFHKTPRLQIEADSFLNMAVGWRSAASLNEESNMTALQGRL